MNESHFNPDREHRLPRNEAEAITAQASVVGDSDYVKDCYWRGYQLGDRFFLGLNDGADLWETTEAIVKDYVTTP